MAIELSYDIEPDEHGVYDGREVARQLIASAFQALTPYVESCPACSDDLFGAIANEVIAGLHDQGRDRGHLPAQSYVGGDEDTRVGRFVAHKADTTEQTYRLLGVDAHNHASGPAA